jgi:hypothetical protein
MSSHIDVRGSKDRSGTVYDKENLSESGTGRGTIDISKPTMAGSRFLGRGFQRRNKFLKYRDTMPIPSGLAGQRAINCSTRTHVDRM